MYDTVRPKLNYVDLWISCSTCRTTNPQQAARQIERIQQVLELHKFDFFVDLLYNDATTTVVDRAKYTTYIQQDKFTTTPATKPPPIQPTKVAAKKTYFFNHYNVLF